MHLAAARRRVLGEHSDEDVTDDKESDSDSDEDEDEDLTVDEKMKTTRAEGGLISESRQLKEKAARDTANIQAGRSPSPVLGRRAGRQRKEKATAAVQAKKKQSQAADERRSRNAVDDEAEAEIGIVERIVDNRCAPPPAPPTRTTVH